MTDRLLIEYNIIQGFYNSRIVKVSDSRRLGEISKEQADLTIDELRRTMYDHLIVMFNHLSWEDQITLWKLTKAPWFYDKMSEEQKATIILTS